jgi:hypothetical protein
MSRRRIGLAGARSLASCTTLDEALEVLSESPYGRDVHPGQTLPQAQRAVAVTLLWHLRILAGWVPRGDSRELRILAGGFEVANVDERLRELTGGVAEPPFHLGSLATAWQVLAGATSVPDLRELLSRSAWGEPGTDSPDGIRLAMRLAWAARVAAAAPRARTWAAGAAALVAARARYVAGARITPEAELVAVPLLGPRWTEAPDLAAFAAQLPPTARWALAGRAEPTSLWQAEAAWWARVTTDGFALLRRPVTTADPVLGAVVVLATDAWRVRAALEVATRGGASAAEALGVFDAVA